jgi:hypothetical protein
MKGNPIKLADEELEEIITKAMEGNSALHQCSASAGNQRDMK